MPKPIRVWSKCDFTLHIFKGVRGDGVFLSSDRLWFPWRLYETAMADITLPMAV